MDEAQFLSLLNMILHKHNCFISEANYESKVLFIEGDEDKIEECATEIETILGDYIQ